MSKRLLAAAVAVFAAAFARIDPPAAQIVEPEILAATKEFLQRDDIPAGARRLVDEGRDGLERSLRAQASDAAAS